ncbi:CES4A [Branchiostoma lanceolatum]|uniref:Carboxylic ester hydrolase n=1 Tax=Branchiostoma lanceolatum TaxID=7740 RepID=A0A8J9YSE1_BRALA|nr:CES4A [Branchiostoma lanceolatum]
MFHFVTIVTAQIIVIFSVKSRDLFCIDYGVTEDGPTVQTQFGAVRGKYMEEGVIFLGLPFAVPPVGELRWKPPEVYNTSWSPAVRDGTLPGPACRQPKCGPTYNDVQHICNRDANRTQSEDCLLGAFGFLETGEGEDDAKGTFGLLDQLEALVWVQENIGSFGGDKNKVTIFGQSAGSDSVATHMISNETAGLFKQAIMMSVPFSLPHKSRQEALRLANLTFNTDEQHMADTIAYHYGNFAHTGDPNKPAHNINSTNNGKPKVVNWPNSTNGHFYGLNITTPESNLLDNYRHERCDVLDSLNVYH